MKAKTLILASALLLSATSATLAQGYVYFGAPGGYAYGPGYGYPGYGYSEGATPYGGGYYDSAPGYGYDRTRGGPGPRVGNGTGMGIGAIR